MSTQDLTHGLRATIEAKDAIIATYRDLTESMESELNATRSACLMHSRTSTVQHDEIVRLEAENDRLSLDLLICRAELASLKGCES